MKRSDAKINAVADLLYDKYLGTFLPLLPPNTDPKDFKQVFITMFRATTGLQEKLAGEVRDLAGGYLTDLKIEDVTYDLGRIDLGSDVVDMLADNLDPKGTANPRNTLDIYGEIISALPVSLQFSPRFYPTEMEFDIRVEPQRKGQDRRDAAPRERPAPDHRRHGDHPPRQTGEIFPRLRIHARPENRHRTASCQARRSETQPLTRRHT